MHKSLFKPKENADGAALTTANIHYYFILVSTFMLVALGACFTKRFVAPKLENVPYPVTDNIEMSDFSVTEKYQRQLKAMFWGLVV